MHCMIDQYTSMLYTRYIFDDVDRHWGYHDTNKDNLISWEEYKESAYGMVESKCSVPL